MLDTVFDCDSIDEVIDKMDNENKEWIIIEMDKEKVIYDISKWIPQHPGGSVIYNGIEANRHYKDKDLYPQSPTQLFSNIPNHKMEGSDGKTAFQKYFLNKNDFVIRIGVLIS